MEGLGSVRFLASERYKFDCMSHSCNLKIAALASFLIMMEIPRFVDMSVSVAIVALSVVNGLRYVLFCGVVWLVAYGFFRRRWLHRKILQVFPPTSDVRREIKHSAISLLIFSVIAALTLEAARRGWTQLYRQPDEKGMVWFWASIVCTI